MDAAVAAATTVLVLAAAVTGQRGQPWAATIVLVIASVSLSWRHRWPTYVLSIALAAYLGDHLLTSHTGPGQPAVLIALYTVARATSPPVALLATAVTASVTAAAQLAGGRPQLSAVAVSLTAVGGAAVIGFSAAERARERRREQAILAQAAAADERVRIARELHDVVAHHLSVIVIQANVVAEAAPEGSALAQPAAGIVASGRQALEEMRRLLGVLRSDAAPEWTPQPGLDSLDALVESITRSGLNVDVAIGGDARPLRPVIDLSAYRIIQEALTNAVRHSHARTARVRVSYDATELELEVTDDGVGSTYGESHKAGFGLAGMRERAELLGGAIDWGPMQPGFFVRARLPI